MNEKACESKREEIRIWEGGEWKQRKKRKRLKILKESFYKKFKKRKLREKSLKKSEEV